jgi:hypothetical protein|tara:strand:- start:5241 stop:6335 length:1095 start_codon:yes stop_codon:yes gene_type:complete
MSLSDEVKAARTEIVADGYEMSIGEVMNLYRDKELFITPEFQRLFRWDVSRKTKFIESLLLGIPIPPIFVFQRDDGVWELVDGLQRLSTIFEFTGILKNEDGDIQALSTLEGTRYLPSLTGTRWESDDDEKSLPGHLQIEIKRARLRVEILKKESDPAAKFELFQRLNTGGAGLSEQEVRNCVAVMLNQKLFQWLKEKSANADFRATVDQTGTARDKQAEVELVLRFLAFRNVPYMPGLDVHEYLDGALMKIATDADFDLAKEAIEFNRTFALINRALGDSAFKRWNGNEFSGKFLMSVFEVVATGVAANIERIESLEDPNAYIRQRCIDLWGDAVFQKNSGAGVRGTTRLTNLLPMAESFFQK